ncbi:type I-F CRISPR-associated endoribonuclease Cas6/Csy4 [Aliiglaciecola sp. M165]|uniref:type I-F CRISPR-associated endoribonuclease Cas6/Csy4 n=1 Tax=Aliiglaciecola sp. M165 TaxID=2593649 RepID=UPI00117D7CAF|nr:type I-F CRISPR-associated endoribonuclease Cas6/Csy4 [Aliiglaciecola sp. M165]TRY33961.1 type I-F CRISPR-associated endoribonuclease Cas6/Csy4 [Aliiglaciecola sp. M165]
MASRYYRKITFIPADSNHNFLIGKCLKVLHGVNCRHRLNSIGVTFPDWSDESPGNSIAFVSVDSACIDLLIDQHYYQQMQDLEYFEISALKPVPENGSEEIMFSRNQAVDELTPAGVRRKLRRCARRAKQRGENYNAAYLSSSEKVFPHFHKIPMNSKSSDRNFSLNIQLEMAQNVTYGNYTSYGLSNKSSRKASVPKNLD